MSLSPLWQSELLVIVHALAAILAIVLGGIQFALPKGTSTHVWLGRIWATVLGLVALSSFGIHHIRTFGPFSVIHLISLFTLYSLWDGVRSARNKKIKEHRKTMITLYVLALILTGAFTLLPGRVFHNVFFGA